MRSNTEHQCVAALARFEAVPELRGFHDRVADTLACGDGEALWRCEQEFSAILSTHCLTRVVNHELQRLLHDPRYMPDDSTEQTMTLIRTEDYSLELRIIPRCTPLPTVVRSLADHCILGLASKGPVTIDLFRQPLPLPIDVFERKRRLIRVGSLELAQAQSLRIQAGYDAFSLHPSPVAQVYMFFRSRPVLRAFWEYSAETLEPLKVIAADSTSSRLQYATRLMAAMNYKEAIPSIAGLLKHPDHFVRWTAIQSVLALDLQKGLELLETATADIHPHVRNAAFKALNLAEQMNQSTVDHSTGGE